MCGRFALTVTTENLASVFEAQSAPELKWDHPVYSIAPSNTVPIVTQQDQRRSLLLASWGFQPAWAKPGAPKPINARVETAATSGMWRAAVSTGRILVPMSGYYEWIPTPTGKQPIYLSSPDLPVLAAAGLTALRNDPATDREILTFAVLTQQASDAAGEIHERMPVFLPDSTWAEWLDAHPLDQPARQHLLGLATDASAHLTTRITSHPVGREVNNTRTVNRHSPGLIQPVD